MHNVSELERTSRSQPMRHAERGSFDRETAAELASDIVQPAYLSEIRLS